MDNQVAALTENRDLRSQWVNGEPIKRYIVRLGAMAPGHHKIATLPDGAVPVKIYGMGTAKNGEEYFPLPFPQSENYRIPIFVTNTTELYMYIPTASALSSATVIVEYIET